MTFAEYVSLEEDERMIVRLSHLAAATAGHEIVQSDAAIDRHRGLRAPETAEEVKQEQKRLQAGFSEPDAGEYEVNRPRKPE